MNSIAAISPLPASYAPQPTSQTTALQVSHAQASLDQAVTSTPATTVMLGQNTTSDTQTYSRPGLQPGDKVQYAWQTDNRNALSSLMLTQLTTGTTGARFQGLGTALLEQLVANGGNAIAQSLLALAGDSQADPATLELQQADLWAAPANSVTFSLKTVSGATVQLSLASNAQGLGVKAGVIGGELSADELNGLGALAGALQSAIDGLTQDPPALQLGSLVQLDATLFSSLQLSASVQAADGEQLFELKLDDTSRNLSLQGPGGEMKLSLDARDVNLLGSAAQRQAAISHYLEQFDAAQKRGKGDDKQMQLFKDAFVQLNHADDQRSATSPVSRSQSLLSGLADFSVSISDSVRHNNPMRPMEADSFSYSASQNSTASAAGSLNSAVQQQQQSSLKASWQQSLNPMAGLALSSERASQNYRYIEVDDQASSSTRLAYRDGKLVEASATQKASQNERVRTYENGYLTDDVHTPVEVSRSRNLLSLLNQVFENDRLSQRARGVSTLEQQLQPQRSLWLLQGAANRIAA